MTLRAREPRHPGVRPRDLLEFRPWMLALAVFLAQLILNTLWSILFFGLRSPLAGLVDIVALWLAILATIVLFFRVSTPAGILLLPYIGWVTFAAILNAAILRLNR